MVGNINFVLIHFLGEPTFKQFGRSFIKIKKRDGTDY